MLKKPFFMGIAGGITSINGITLENLIGLSGLNTGNFLFVRGLRQYLGMDNLVYTSFSNDEFYKNDYDSIVISAANWIDDKNNLQDMANFLATTRVPIIVVGLGSQLGFNHNHLKITTGTRKFLDIISERSKLISVRGETTALLLERLGVKNVCVTGCPSLLGKHFNFECMPNNLTVDKISKIVLQGSRHGISNNDFEDVFNLSIYQYAIDNDLHLLLQSERPDMYYAMNRLNNDKLNGINMMYLARIYLHDKEKISSFLRNRGLVYWNVDDWIDGMRNFDYLIGTRIHGVIASLISGVPATLLIHDKRTEEMAKFFHIPFIDSREHHIFHSSLISKAIEEFDLSFFKKNYQRYLDNFTNFFVENDLYSHKTELLL